QEILTYQKLDPPNHFISEAILERLQGYSISYHPTEQAFADIITMLCMHPAKVTTLYIANGRPYSIKPSDLHELGANYTAMIHEPENPGQRFIIM
ncbi:12767_t:CDS:2, partial [Racocetra persica]